MKLKTHNGFTLIEIMVAVSIFVIILSAATGYFTTAMVSQRQVLATRPMVDEVSFLAEYLSRALRPAQKALDADCIPEGSYYEVPAEDRVKFIDRDARCRAIYMENGTLKEIVDGGAPENLTSASIEIAQITFKVLDSEPEIIRHSRITIALEVLASGAAASPQLQWQTTISQRELTEEI